MTNRRNKGQTILSVLMWATGVSLAVAGTTGTFVLNKFTRIDDINIRQDLSIGEISGDIKAINVKLDLLLKANGISEKTVRLELNK